MGHDIAPGASYCAQGHPIALDHVHFAPNDAYAAKAASPTYGSQPQQQPQAYAPAPVQPQGFGAPQPQYAPAQQFGAPPPQPFGAPPAHGPFAPAAPPPAYAAAAVPAPADTSRDVAPHGVLRGFLVAYGSNPNGDFWPLTGGRLVVGRTGTGDGIDIPLQDPTISSRHAALAIDATSATIVLEDTGSTNGTFVNDEHIGFNGRRELRDGDRIRFGGFATVVKVIGRV